MSTPTRTKEDIREAVRERYAEAAMGTSAGAAGCCGSAESSCGCGTNAQAGEEVQVFGAELYSGEDRDSLPDAAKLASLGLREPDGRRRAPPG